MKCTQVQAGRALAAAVSHALADLLEMQPMPGWEIMYLNELFWLLALPEIEVEGDFPNLAASLDARIAARSEVLRHIMDRSIEALWELEEIAA